MLAILSALGILTIAVVSTALVLGFLAFMF